MTWLRSSNQESFFNAFDSFNSFLSEKFTETHSLSLMSLAEQAWLYMKSAGASDEAAEEVIVSDYCNGSKKRDLPVFLKNLDATKKKLPRSLNQRQLNHLN
jgi:hypothetical protein